MNLQCCLYVCASPPSTLFNQLTYIHKTLHFFISYSPKKEYDGHKNFWGGNDASATYSSVLCEYYPVIRTKVFQQVS